MRLVLVPAWTTTTTVSRVFEPRNLCNPVLYLDGLGNQIVRCIIKNRGNQSAFITRANGTKEDYLIMLPCLRNERLWYGSYYIELTVTCYIQSSCGGLSTIVYHGKGYFPQCPGKSHIFKTDLTPAIGSGSSFQASNFGQRRNTTSEDLRTDAVFVDVTGRMEEPREHRRSTNSFM